MDSLSCQGVHGLRGHFDHLAIPRRVYGWYLPSMGS
jgi:hypothetical protein